MAASPGVLDAFQHLGWVDVTALSVLGVFFLVGLFKGFLWQVSRVAILLIAYAVAAHFGQSLSEVLLGWTHAGPDPAGEEQQATAFYVACVLIFLGVLIVLSLLALLLQRLVKKAGMTFFDRLGGGVVGVATGGIVVLFAMMLVFMFFPRSHVALAAEQSHSLRFSRWAVDQLAGVLPEGMQRVFPRVPAQEQRRAPGEVQPAEAGAHKDGKEPAGQQAAPKAPEEAPAPARGGGSAAKTPAARQNG